MYRTAVIAERVLVMVMVVEKVMVAVMVMWVQYMNTVGRC